MDGGGSEDDRQALAECRRLCLAGRLPGKNTRVCSVADVTQGRVASSDDSQHVAATVATVGLLNYRSARDGTSAISSWFLSDGDAHLRLAFVNDPPLQWLGSSVVITCWRLCKPFGRSKAGNASNTLPATAYVEASACELLRGGCCMSAAAAAEPQTITFDEAVSRFGAKTLADVATDRTARQAAASAAAAAAASGREIAAAPLAKKPRASPQPPLLACVVAISPAVAVGTGCFCLVALAEACGQAAFSANLVLSGVALAWRAKLRVGGCYCLHGLAHSRLGPYAVFSVAGGSSGDSDKGVRLPVEVKVGNGSEEGGSQGQREEDAVAFAAGDCGGVSTQLNGAALATTVTPDPGVEASAAEPAAAAEAAQAALPLTVSYEGTVTGVGVKSMAGLYELDSSNRLKLFMQLFPCSGLGAGMRVGAKVRLDNVHPVYLWGRLEGLGCCLRSACRVTAFSGSSGAGYRPLIGGSGSLRSLVRYAWQYRFRCALADKGLSGGSGDGKGNDGGGSTCSSTARRLPSAVLEALASWLLAAAACDEGINSHTRRDVYQEFFAHDCGGCNALGREALRCDLRLEAARSAWPGAAGAATAAILPPLRYPKLPTLAEVLEGAVATAMTTVREALLSLQQPGHGSGGSGGSGGAGSGVTGGVPMGAAEARTVVTVRTDLCGCVGKGYETLVAGWITAEEERSVAATSAGATPPTLWIGDATGWVRLVVTGAPSPGTGDDAGGRLGEAGGISGVPVLRAKVTDGAAIFAEGGRAPSAAASRFLLARGNISRNSQHGDAGPSAPIFAPEGLTMALDPLILTEVVIFGGGDGGASAAHRPAAAGAAGGSNSSSCRSYGVRSNHTGPMVPTAGAADTATVGDTVLLARHYLVVSLSGLRQYGKPMTPEPDTGASVGASDAAAATHQCSGSNSRVHASREVVPSSAPNASSVSNRLLPPIPIAGLAAAAAAAAPPVLSVADALVVTVAAATPHASGSSGGGGGSNSRGNSGATRLDAVHATESVAVEGILRSVEFRERESATRRWHGKAAAAAANGDVVAALAGWQLCLVLEDCETPDTLFVYLETRPPVWPMALIPGRSVIRVHGICRRLSANAKNLYLRSAATAAGCSVQVLRLIGMPPPSGMLHFGCSSGGSGDAWVAGDDVAPGLLPVMQGEAPMYLYPRPAPDTAGPAKPPRRCVLGELCCRGRLVRSRCRAEASVVAIHFAKAYPWCTRCNRKPPQADAATGRCRTAGCSADAFWKVFWEATATLDDGTGTAHLCLEGDTVATLLRLKPAERTLIERAAATKEIAYHRSTARGEAYDTSGRSSGFGDGGPPVQGLPAVREAEAALEKAARSAAAHRGVSVDFHQLLRRGPDCGGCSSVSAEYPLRTIDVGRRELDTLSLPQLLLQAVAVREANCEAAGYEALARLAALELA